MLHTVDRLPEYRPPLICTSYFVIGLRIYPLIFLLQPSFDHMRRAYHS